MIPKIIHYCWFGNAPLTPLSEKCIASWKKYLPDYEIRRWDESNFDVYAHPYSSDAYKAGKYAFVSDYARFKILYQYGGLYFDTDVEIIAPYRDIAERKPFMGFENDGVDGVMAVNPGLGIGAEPGMALYKMILDRYDTLPFLLENGERNPYSMIQLVTDILKSKGLNGNTGIEWIGGVLVYPQNWFNPFDDATGRLHKTADTKSIHWYSKSWMQKQSGVMVFIKRMARRIFGQDFVSRLGKKIK